MSHYLSGWPDGADYPRARTDKQWQQFISAKRPLRKPVSAPKITLTKDEREWLGKTVTLRSGAVGTVWALAPRSCAWVIPEGTYRQPLEVPLSELTE